MTTGTEIIEQKIDKIICEWLTAANSRRAKDISLSRARDLRRALMVNVYSPDHDWSCRCGHWNAPSLNVCADCGRKPNEG